MKPEQTASDNQIHTEVSASEQQGDTVEQQLEADTISCAKKDTDPSQDIQNTDVQNELDSCQAELADWKDRFFHVSADMQNYKRRIEKERALWTHRSQEAVLVGLLSIVDDFDRALAEHQKREAHPEFDAWVEGFLMIAKELYKYLAQVGVTPMEQVNQFDPTLHEAMVQVDSSDHESGAIVEVMEQGFMLNDKVLRPAKVVVAK